MSDFNPRSHEGSDLCLKTNAQLLIQFQSALPRGERRNLIHSLIDLRKFQSALPRGERLGWQDRREAAELISIRAPTRGATIFPELER